MSPKALPYISLLATFWGTTLVVSRFSLGQFESLTYVALRILVAALAYVVILIARGKRQFPRGREYWQHGAMLGVFSTAVPMTCIVLSLQYQSSGVTGLILTLGPAITVLLAHFLLPDEKLNRRKAAGIALALSGGALLILLGENGLPNVSETNPLGYLFVLIALCSGSIMIIYTRKYMRNLGSTRVSSVRMWVAALILIPLANYFAGFDLSQANSGGFVAVLYAGLIGTFAGMLLDFHNIKRFGATASAMVSVLIPIVAIITGALFLGEAITPGMIMAMVLIIGGVVIVNFGGDPETHPHTPENIQL